MNKLSQDQVANHFYNLGVQMALEQTKTAGLSEKAIRKLLSAGGAESRALGRAFGERQLGQMGTLYGGAGGAALGAGLGAEGGELLALLGGLGGAAGGGALGNIVGRNVGAPLGELNAALTNLRPFKATGNFLADPLRRVPGIRG